MILLTNSLFLTLHFSTNFLIRKPYLYRFYRIPIGMSISTFIGYLMNDLYIRTIDDVNKSYLHSKRKASFDLLDRKDGNFIKNHEEDLLNYKDILKPK